RTRSRLRARKPSSPTTTFNARVSPVLSATSASNALPACETNPSPSALTFTVIWRPACVTFMVILPSRPCEHQQPAQCLLRRTVKRPRPSGPLLLHERSGLGRMYRRRNGRPRLLLVGTYDGGRLP